MLELDDAFWTHLENVEGWEVGKRDIHAKGFGECTPLLWVTLASPAFLVDLLIDAGSDIHQRDDIGRTCLHYAANSNRPDLVQLFLNLGVDPMVCDSAGKTAWDLIRDENTPEVHAILEPVMLSIADQETLEQSLPQSNKTTQTPRM